MQDNGTAGFIKFVLTAATASPLIAKTHNQVYSPDWSNF